MFTILPAAGSAQRMRGIPKFLLPVDSEARSLLESHINQLIPLGSKIIIPVHPDHEYLVRNIASQYESVEVFPLVSNTMSETVLRTIRNFDIEEFALFMPDTVFLGEQPYSSIRDCSDEFTLFCWGIRDDQRGKLGQIDLNPDGHVGNSVDKDPNCLYPYSWGAIHMRKSAFRFLDASTPHVGYAIKQAMLAGLPVGAKIISGEYFDCGTADEYFRFLSRRSEKPV
jgi:hypothetical protein